jgi:tRNA dimethylallyltransferase
MKTNKTVIVICGPTATGKTEIASHLCAAIGGEIISADSRQVYRFLDTGTNKSGAYITSKNIRVTSAGIPQHLTDIINPDEIFSAGDFAREANKLINSLLNSNTIPVITGGTGLYIKALVDGLAPMPEKNEMIRAEINETLKKHGTERLYLQLKEADPVNAEKNRYNPQRLIRAVEVLRLTGKPMSYWHLKTIKPDWNFVQFAPLWKREEMYNNINERSAVMLKSGMIEETNIALSMGYNKLSPGLGSIGYKHVLGHIEGRIDIKQTEELISQDTRRYAKRQMTWFRSVPGINWIETGNGSFDPKLIASAIKNML